MLNKVTPVRGRPHVRLLVTATAEMQAAHDKAMVLLCWASMLTVQVSAEQQKQSLLAAHAQVDSLFKTPSPIEAFFIPDSLITQHRYAGNLVSFRY